MKYIKRIQCIEKVIKIFRSTFFLLSADPIRLVKKKTLMTMMDKNIKFEQRNSNFQFKISNDLFYYSHSKKKNL